MEKFRVTMWFKDKQVIVSAKNATDARKKAYKKLEKIPAIKLLDKKQTDIY